MLSVLLASRYMFTPQESSKLLFAMTRCSCVSNMVKLLKKYVLDILLMQNLPFLDIEHDA